MTTNGHVVEACGLEKSYRVGPLPTMVNVDPG